MKLQEIFDHLSGSEFSQLGIGGASAGVISETNYTLVVGHVNLALTALYSRFNLKEGSLELQLQAEQTEYKLKSSESYVLGDTFTDDIIKVEKVLTDADKCLPLNDASSAYSVTTPSSKVLRVPKAMVDETLEWPEELVTDTLTVSYRANHPKLVVGVGFDPEEVEVELPETHLVALLYYIASRVHNPVGMVNEFNAGNNYFAKYEQACQVLEGKGLQVDLGASNTRASRNGWA